MKPIKLKDLLKEVVQETEAPHFPTEKSHQNHGADYVDSLINKLTPQQREDNAEIFGILRQWFEAVQKERGDMLGAAKSAAEALRWNDIDPSLVDEYFSMESGADMDDPYDDRDRESMQEGRNMDSLADDIHKKVQHIKKIAKEKYGIG